MYISMGSLVFEWSEEELGLEQFTDAHTGDLPKVVYVRDGFDDEEAKNSYASDEVYFIVAVARQTRVIARDRARRLLSVPLEYPVYTRVVSKSGKFVSQVERPKLLKQVIRRIRNKVITENHVVFHDNQAVNIQSGLGGSYETKVDVLEILDLHEQKYLIGHSVIDGEIEETVTALPVYVPITVSVATDTGSNSGKSLSDFYRTELASSEAHRRQIDMEDLYNNDIMVMPDNTLKELDEFKTKDEVLLRIILRTQELRLSMDSSDASMDSPIRKDLAKRGTMDRSSLPPPPAPPCKPPLTRASTLVGHALTPPQSPKPPPPAEFADNPGGETVQLPSKTPPTKRHFKLQNLLPSGGFPSLSLDRIKEKVKQGTRGIRKKYLFHDDTRLGSGSSDVTGERPLSSLTDDEYDGWSDDSFDENFDDDEAFEEGNSVEIVKENMCNSPDTESKDKPSGPPKPRGGFSSVLLSKFKRKRCQSEGHLADDDDIDSLLSSPVISSSHETLSSAVKDGGSAPDSNEEVKTSYKSPPKPPPKAAVLRPPHKNLPSLPSKPRGHFERLSTAAGLGSPPNSPKGSAPKMASAAPLPPKKPSVLELAGKLNSDSENSDKKPSVARKPQLSKKPAVNTSPLASPVKPKPPPKPKANGDTTPSSEKPNVKTSLELSPKRPVKPSVSPRVPAKAKPTHSVPELDKKASRASKSDEISKVEIDSIQSPVPGKKPPIERKMKFTSARRSYTQSGAYVDIDIEPALKDARPELKEGGHEYDEVYVTTAVDDRSSGDGAEMDDSFGHYEGVEFKPKPSDFSSKSSVKTKSLPVPPGSSPKPPAQNIEDLYAQPLRLKKKGASPASKMKKDSESSSAGITSGDKSQKYSNLSEVPVDLSQLSVIDVIQCLALLKMSKYSDDFRENEIDGTLLADLDEGVLQDEFKFSPFDAKKVVKFTNGWRPKLK